MFKVNASVPDDPGVAALRAHLMRVAAGWPMRSEEGLFRLAVDRVFTLPGRGTVATGTVLAGRVRVGDTVSVMPAGTEVRVRSIHAQNRDSATGRAGQRCALNLTGIDKAALKRGDWLADSRALVGCTRLDAQLRWLPDSASLSNRAPLHVHLGTADRVARVVMLEAEHLVGGGNTRVQLVFDAPICAAPGDFFIARDAQARRTLGGGVIIDPVAPVRRRRSPQRLAYLAAIQGLLRGEGLEMLLENCPLGIDRGTLMRLTGSPPERIALPAGARIVDPDAKSVVILDSHWQALAPRSAG